jgi:uncharacterized SAM-binding protein YcdF (DUF218 family)
MFGRKYIFETKATRLRRLLASSIFLLLFGIAVISSFIVYIPIYAKMQKGRAAGAFFQKSPDAIAVFTGDRGRIAYALELLKKNPSAKLLISGVGASSYKTIVAKQANPTTAEAVISEGLQVDLDYESKNTFENVDETIEFIKKNPDLKKVLIISSDYHIMRINLILSHYIQNRKPEIFFDSVTNTYKSWPDLKKLLKEAVKIARTFFLLKILRENVISVD